MIVLMFNETNLICDYYINENKIIAIHATNTENYDSYCLFYCKSFQFAKRCKTFHLKTEINHKYD